MKATIIGRIYSEEMKYYTWDESKEFPYFDTVAGSKKQWGIEVENLKQAQKWFANNHPEYFMGGCIQLENGDFSMFAVPSGEYGNGNYETLRARINYVKNVFA